MSDQTEDSNLDNKTPSNDSDNMSEQGKKSENKISSTKPLPKAADDKPTDQAVDDIVRHESDEVLAAEDSKLANAFEPEKKPWYKKLFAKKKVWIPTVIVLLLIILFALPLTRYKILGIFVKKNLTVVVIDQQTHLAVSSANVTLRNSSGMTNNYGKTSLHVPVGYATILASKKYYQTSSQKIVVPLRHSHQITIYLHATGRQVPIKVIDLVSQKPIANATVSADQTSARTNQQGTATIVLPANQSSTPGKITNLSGYNDSDVTIKVLSNPGNDNTFSVTPSGHVYFLSNASGKIDIVSTNLDGTGRQTILNGTGNENASNTQLTHSADWKYLALLTTRSSLPSDSGTLYAINTSTGQLTTVQSGLQNTISVFGWANDARLIYTSQNNSVNCWQPGAESLVSYNPITGKSTTLDTTSATGTSTSDCASQSIDNEFIQPNDSVLYTKVWNDYKSNNGNSSGLQNGIYVVNADGSGKQTLKTVQTDFSGYFNVIQNKPNDFYISAQSSSPSVFFEYINGSLRVAPDNVNDQTFNNYFSNTQPIYYLSPNGNANAWSVTRDGQAIIQKGDSSANNAQTIATLGINYNVAGWSGNNYVLVEKSNSQLYVIPASGLSNGMQPIKITDYFTFQAHN